MIKLVLASIGGLGLGGSGLVYLLLTTEIDRNNVEGRFSELCEMLKFASTTFGDVPKVRDEVMAVDCGCIVGELIARRGKQQAADVGEAMRKLVLAQMGAALNPQAGEEAGLKDMAGSQIGISQNAIDQFGRSLLLSAKACR